MREGECRGVKLESAKKTGEERTKEGLEVSEETQKAQSMIVSLTSAAPLTVGRVLSQHELIESAVKNQDTIISTK